MSFEAKPITDLLDFNPKRTVKKGTIAPFIDMAALSTSSRDVDEIAKKEFKSGGAKFSNGDTLFARITPCLENGKTAKVSGLSKGENGFGSTEFIVMSAKEPEYDEDFVYYLARLPEFRAYAKSRMEGTSGRQRVPWQSLTEFKLSFPQKAQRKIVGKYLRAFDDKIALNSQTNKTLEEMAQAIFKSWFVDFEPVKAKMNGEQPEGMDAATASLFPEKLVESELGLTPEGWEIKPIKDLCSKVQNGGTPKRNESSYWDDGDIPWLTSGEVRQSIITSVENRITQLGLDKSSAKWVPELSTLVALYGATAGEVSLTSIPLTTNQAVCALMPNKEHQWYNYLQLKSRVAELAGKAVGSAQQNISKGLVESTEVLSVPEPLLEAFNAQVENLFKLRICNLQENVELAKLRDTLLPKLLSGEINLDTTEINLDTTEELVEVN